jgi:hypothetical protein
MGTMMRTLMKNPAAPAMKPTQPASENRTMMRIAKIRSAANPPKPWR